MHDKTLLLLDVESPRGLSSPLFIPHAYAEYRVITAINQRLVRADWTWMDKHRSLLWDVLIKPQHSFLSSALICLLPAPLPLWRRVIVIIRHVQTVFHSGVWKVGGQSWGVQEHVGIFSCCFFSLHSVSIMLSFLLSLPLSRPWRNTAPCSATCLKTSPTKTWSSSSRPARRTSPRMRATTSPPPRSGSATWRRTTSWPMVRNRHMIRSVHLCVWSSRFSQTHLNRKFFFC